MRLGSVRHEIPYACPWRRPLVGPVAPCARGTRTDRLRVRRAIATVGDTREKRLTTEARRLSQRVGRRVRTLLPGGGEPARMDNDAVG